MAKAAQVGLFKVEPTEIDAWEIDEYVRILAAAKSWDPSYYAAVCLAGEAGLRIGEVKALRWRVDVDMVAKTIIVNQQMRRGIVGTPKGRTRRTVPMTATLYDALRALDAVREGVRDPEPAGQSEVRREPAQVPLVPDLPARPAPRARVAHRRNMF